MEKSKSINIIKFIASIVICQVAGGIGAIFTTQSVQTWYPTLQKPSFNPPNWLFAPVWTLLYLLMGISLFLIWKDSKDKKNAVILFSIQLVLNVLWSVCFFGLKIPLLGLIVIVILLAFILANIISFYKISKIAGILLIPYLLWVSFATVLNFSLWMLNR